MTLSFGKTSPQDMLEKAERDLARLKASESAQDRTAGSDAMFDLTVSVTNLKDWLNTCLRQRPIRSSLKSPQALPSVRFATSQTAASIASFGGTRLKPTKVPRQPPWSSIAFSLPNTLHSVRKLDLRRGVSKSFGPTSRGIGQSTSVKVRYRNGVPLCHFTAWGMMRPNSALDRTVNHRGHVVLAMDCVLADAQSKWWPAAQLCR